MGQEPTGIEMKSRYQCKKLFWATEVGLRLYSKTESAQTPRPAVPLPGTYSRDTLDHVYKETSTGRHSQLTFMDVEISIKI